MRRTFIIAAAAGFAVLPILSGQAQAQAPRTFVSGHGEDTNPCSLLAPCRSFAQALNQTTAGGEITVLDSAGFGVLTINKSITITNPGGVEAGITTVSGADAITISPSISIVVTLRGLTLQGGGVGNNGINLTSSAGGTLNIMDCVVKDFTESGIAIQPDVPGNTPQTLNVVIANSFAVNNTQNGINLAPQNGNSALVTSIYHTTATGNGTGIAFSTSHSDALISDSHVDMNNVGVSAEAGGFQTIKNSTIQENSSTQDLNVSPATVFLFNNNTIGNVHNMGITFTDGTNNITAVSANALANMAPK